MNFRKCKFKKIKKLKSYITTHVKKSTEINAKNKKIQQKHKTHAPLIANSKQIIYYHKLHNSFTIHKYFTFRNTGKWSGMAMMGQRGSKKYGSFENDTQL